MKTKITIPIKKSILEKAESCAKKSGQSLSDLVEKYLTELISENIDLKVSPKLKRIIGAVKLPKNFDEKKERSKRTIK